MKIKILFLLILIIFSFIACTENNRSQQTAADNTAIIVHSLDTVEVPLNPQRVIALDFSALEILDYLGVHPIAIPKSGGVPSHLRKYKDDTSIADVGTVVDVNLEKINELQPDLIIIGGRLADSYDDLSSIAPVIYPMVIGTNDFMATFENNLSDFGKVFEKKEVLDKALNDIKTKVNMMKEKTSKSSETALILLHNRGRFSAFGSGSRFGIIHDIFGVEEAEKGMGTHLHGNPVSSEFIQKVNPDIIFIIDRSQIVGDETMNKGDVENRLVKQTNAAQNGKIFYLNPEVWYLAGSGIASVNMMIEEVSQAF